MNSKVILWGGESTKLCVKAGSGVVRRQLINPRAVTCHTDSQGCKGGRRIELYSNPNSKPPSLVIFLVIWVETEQIACGNLCLEPKVSENSESGSE